MLLHKETRPPRLASPGSGLRQRLELAQPAAEATNVGVAVEVEGTTRNAHNAALDTVDVGKPVHGEWFCHEANLDVPTFLLTSWGGVFQQIRD